METIVSFLTGLLGFALQFVQLIINVFLYVLTFFVSLLQQLLAAVS